VSCDTTVNPSRYTIENPFFALRPPPGIAYPFRADELWLFCQFSDATGRHTFHVDLSWDVDRQVRHIHTFNVDFGTDRLAVRNHAVRLTKVPFRRPGVYEFRLRTATTELARTTVRLEDAR
jgi:hypothetical protein